MGPDNLSIPLPSVFNQISNSNCREQDRPNWGRRGKRNWSQIICFKFECLVLAHKRQN